MNTKTILVIGATGNQGGAVVAALRQQTKFAIRAFVQPASNESPRVEELRQQGVKIFQGDLDDSQSLVRAMEDTYGVFCVLNFRNGGVAKEEERGKLAADIAHRAGVRHYIYSSVGGADRKSGVPHFESKWQVEQHIRDIGLLHSIVRPVSFMTNLMMVTPFMRFMALSTFRSTLSNRSTQMIAVKDIGKWVAHMFANPQQYLGQAVELAGDEVTFDQMISAYQKVYGKRLFSIKLPSGMFARGDAGKMITWISEHGYQADIRALRQAVPDMLTFEQFINEKRIL